MEETNIDAKYIEDAVDKIFSGKYKEVHSMLIFKNNKPVLEEYFQGRKWKWDAAYYHGELVTWDTIVLSIKFKITQFLDQFY